MAAGCRNWPLGEEGGGVDSIQEGTKRVAGANSEGGRRVLQARTHSVLTTNVADVDGSIVQGSIVIVFVFVFQGA